MMTYVECHKLVEPREIRELEPILSDGSEYLIRVMLGDGVDRIWGEWMTATSKELAKVLFPVGPQP